MLKGNINQTEYKQLIHYQNCPAKTFTDDFGIVKPGRTVFNHCQIVGHVAREMINRMNPDLACSLFPKDAEFAAACHDIGKVSPTFYNKIMRACSLEQLPGFNPDLESQWGGHAGVSQLTAQYIKAPQNVPEILGCHHGFSPLLKGLRAYDDNFGGQTWLDERKKLIKALEADLNSIWPELQSHAQARLVAGLTSVADWIGSGAHFENPEHAWQTKISSALDDAGFIAPQIQANLSFENIFQFSPRPIQTNLIDQIKGPGVYILEAPMGMGKTEAALYAAYKMLASNKARGVYFALPTQLTSNTIFTRFQKFLQQILSETCSHKPLLLHANAWLYETDIGEEGRPGGSWFSQNKRGLLAPFAVGTLDQALMAVMNVKHGFVRAFGLAGKVVILDEVHTYDAYTGVLLDALIDLLRQLECTVIILSATLDHNRRQTLLKRPLMSSDYPLITASSNEPEVSTTEVGGFDCESQQVQIKLCSDDRLAIEQALLLAEQGQQILWIENTVNEAQQRYLDVASRAKELNVECGLVHSRYSAQDRQIREDYWVSIFGKAGWPHRQKQGRILIGTQVLEQSLDIDADFLITRFAPTDMLLQRIGRLWRHSETPRHILAQPLTWILAPDLDAARENPKQAFGASAFVYAPYVLCRSLEVWQNLIIINLPNDIRQLIEATYCQRHEQGKMGSWLDELENGTGQKLGTNALKQLARVALAQGGKTLPETKAQTRYSESETHEVLLLRRIRRHENVSVLTLMDDTVLELPLKKHKLNKSGWRQLARLLSQQLVKVPASQSPKPSAKKTLEYYGLQHCFYLGSSDWPDDESNFRVALVNELDELRGIENTQMHDSFKFEYRQDLGYRVIKDL